MTDAMQPLLTAWLLVSFFAGFAAGIAVVLFKAGQTRPKA